VRTMLLLIGPAGPGAAVDMKNSGHHVLQVMKMVHLSFGLMTKH